MSDPVSEPHLASAPRAPPAAPILSGRRGAAVIGFATGLIIFGLLVMTGPFWAPAIVPLFMSGAQPPPEQALAERIAQLEAARREDQQKTSQAVASMQRTAADTAATLQQLDRRIAALESRPAASAGDMGEVRQQLEKLAAAGGELNRRIAALEKAEQAQSAADPTDTALLLAVLRIREAIEVA